MEDGEEGQPQQPANATEELPQELKLIEDLCYIHSLWPAMREQIQSRQEEFAMMVHGAPETRWTFWKHALVQKVGATQILKRLTFTWGIAVAVQWTDVEGLSLLEAQDRLKQLVLSDLMSINTRLKDVEAAISVDAWLKDSFGSFDVVTVDPDHVTFDNLLDAYQGKWILDAFEVTARMLNPEGVSIEELRTEGATLKPPDDCPISAITSDTLPPLLVDLASQTVRVRLIMDEIISSTFVSPHLAAIEERRAGIFFEVHHFIGLHQDIANLFGDADRPWDVGDIGPLNCEFALALEVGMRYAQDHELEMEARAFVDEAMTEYADYHRPQVQEFWENPAFRIGGLGSPETDAKDEDHAVFHARYLLEEGRPELLAAAARYAHCTVEALTDCLEGAAYKGPLKLLVNDELWEQLQLFGHDDQDGTLADCEGVDELRACVHRHYKALFISNTWCEELVKEFKNLSPQARAHPASAEVRILQHQRLVLERLRDGRRFFKLPSKVRIKAIRVKLRHHLRARARPAREPPASLSRLSFGQATTVRPRR